MRTTNIAFTTLAALLLAACTTDRPDGQGGQVPISLTASVQAGSGMTRADDGIQSAQFDEDETFYAYFPSGATVGNSTYKTSDDLGNTTCTGTQPYFNAGTSSVTVHAYYGKSGGSGGTQVTNSTATFSVALDQTGTAGYKASDLMYATTTVTVDKSVGQTSATGSLTFSHKMSKIIVSAKAGDGIAAIQKVRIIGGCKSIGIANATTTDESTTPFFGNTPTLTGDITAAEASCVKLYEDATGQATVDCAALIPPQAVPQTGTDETDFLLVDTDQGSVTYKLAGKAFESGQAYTFTITVSLADIGQVVTIHDWDANGSVTVNPIKGGSAPDLTPTALNLTYKGSSQTLTATLAGSSAFSAISSNTGIAMVSVTGNTITVRPVAPGECTVNVFPTDVANSFSSTICNVTVAKAPATISFATASYRREVDDVTLTQTVSNTYNADGATGDGSVTYSVTNSGGSNASINSTTGEVTLGGKAGTVTVKATVADGTYCTYAVKEATYTIVIASKTGVDVAEPTVGDWGDGGTVDGFTPDKQL